jgi:hypothetical protein
MHKGADMTEQDAGQDDVRMGHDADQSGLVRTDQYTPIATHQDLEDTLAKLTGPQLRYLEHALGASSTREALREAEVGKSTFYEWENRGALQDLVRALRVDGSLMTIGRERMRRLAGQAIDTFERNLRAQFAKDQNQAAAELLDRAGLGKTTNVKVELSRPAEESQQYIERLNAARRSLQASGISLSDDDDSL